MKHKSSLASILKSVEIVLGGQSKRKIAQTSLSNNTVK